MMSFSVFINILFIYIFFYLRKLTKFYVDNLVDKNIEGWFSNKMYSDKNDLLTKAKDLLKDEMTTISYTTWIKNLEIQSISDNKIVLIALSKMQKDAIESRLFDLVCNTFNFITNKNCEIEIIEKNGGLNLLDEKTQIALQYRKKYPESSIKELSEIISSETGKPLTKSGLNHRLRKIKELSEKIKKQEQKNN